MILATGSLAADDTGYGSVVSGTGAGSKDTPASDNSGGYDALLLRLGAATPTGTGVGMCQVEASADGTGIASAPDLTSSEFAGKSVSIVNTSTVSWHSTTVASWLYGLNTSMAKGVGKAWVHNLNNWLPEKLKVGDALMNPPAVAPSTSRVYNNSWIGSYGGGNDAYDREAIRRFDYLMYRDGILAVSGENNGTGSARYPMMGDTFNGLSVGRLDLQHSAGLTGSLSDTPGRMKPEIIAPGAYTSFCTPVVGAAAALLFQQVQAAGSLATGLAVMPKAQLVKAALLAGATRDSSWDNHAPQSGTQRGITTLPLDPIRGAGGLNVDFSNRILGEYRNDGATVAVNAERSSPNGFGSFTMSALQHRYWRIRVTRFTPTLDFVVTWPRVVAGNFNSYTYANLDLRVYRGIYDAAVLLPLEGNAGVKSFGSGNVTSSSTVNNIEVIHMKDLQQGEYVVDLSRIDNGSTSVQVSAAWRVDPIGFGLDGDLDGSGLVDGGDIGQVLLNMDSDDPAGDADLSGWVDFGDVGWVLLNFD
ncbi:MAG: hypothetical protein K8R92_02795 [Planctomycetes bacterium]|nr:hypothetical protein [Planctomycetota bacterium]